MRKEKDSDDTNSRPGSRRTRGYYMYLKIRSPKIIFKQIVDTAGELEDIPQ